MVAISAEYRIKKIHNTSPKEALVDAKSAIRWVRGNAQALGIYPTKIVVGGGSAGGPIAAATATSKGFNESDEDATISARPIALMLFNPVLDTGPDGFGYGRVKGYWRDFSPLHNLNANSRVISGDRVVLLSGVILPLLNKSIRRLVWWFDMPIRKFLGLHWKASFFWCCLRSMRIASHSFFASLRLNFLCFESLVTSIAVEVFRLIFRLCRR